jgi:hypothetical protein
VCPRARRREIVELLNKEVNLALRDPAILAKLKELGGTPIPGSAADFGKVVADETAKWEKVVNTANLSVKLICATDRIGNSRQTGAASPSFGVVNTGRTQALVLGGRRRVPLAPG